MISEKPTATRRASTLLGLLAIVFWGSVIAFVRSVTESLGLVNTVLYTYVAGGVLSVAFLGVRNRGFGFVRTMGWKYLLIAGGIFVVYTVCFYAAIGLAADRQQALEIGLINYLWPACILVFSVPVLKKKANLLLPLGIVTALAGLWLVLGGRTSPAVIVSHVAGNPLPYVLSFAGAVTWGLYSVLSSRWAKSDQSGVPFFLLAVGLIFLVVKLFHPEAPAWTLRSAAELAYLVVFVTILAYVFWDAGMQRGDLVLLASLSYFIPFISTLLSVLILGVRTSTGLWIGCGLLILGSFVCKWSIQDDKPLHRGGAA
jgi:drug/metabolite transporter (DMT)-like permease